MEVRRARMHRLLDLAVELEIPATLHVVVVAAAVQTQQVVMDRALQVEQVEQVEPHKQERMGLQMGMPEYLRLAPVAMDNQHQEPQARLVQGGQHMGRLEQAATREEEGMQIFLVQEKQAVNLAQEEAMVPLEEVQVQTES